MKTVFLIFLLISQCVFAQKPILEFKQSKVKLGEPIQTTFQYTHSSDEAILFPDSTYDFQPFVCLSVKAFPTQTLGNTSKDSVVYTLAIFENDSLQKLKLPIWKITDLDTITQFSNLDSIRVKLVTDSLPTANIISYTPYIPLSPKFDYYFWGSIIVTVLLVFGIIFFVFGKRIRKAIKLYFFNLQHNRFINDFDKLITLNKRESGSKYLEKIVSRWKEYLENIFEKPIRTYTTKEIMKLIQDEELGSSLSKLDKLIYGETAQDDINLEFEVLKKVANFYFEAKREELRNE